MKQLDKRYSEKIITVLQLIKNSDAERDYFFNKLRSANDPFEWLEPLIDEGYFDLRRNPEPIVSPNKNEGKITPYWDVLGFLENLATKNQVEKRNDVECFLTGFINSNIDNIDLSDPSKRNYITEYHIVKYIFLLPPAKITLRHISYITKLIRGSNYHSLIPEELYRNGFTILLGAGKSKYVVSIVKAIFLPYKAEKKVMVKEYISKFDPYRMQKIVKKYGAGIGKLCGEEVTEAMAAHIKKIIRRDKSQFNIVWIPHIREHTQNRFTTRYEFQLVEFLKLCLSQLPTKILRTTIELYLKEEYPILNRIGIYFIDEYYDELKGVLWSNEKNPFDYYSVKHELYHFLDSHANEFSVDDITKLLTWIEAVDMSYLDGYCDDAKEKEMQVARFKKEWLIPLMKTDYDEVEKLFTKYDNINPVNISRPGYDYWSGDISFEANDTERIDSKIFEKDNEEIAEYLSNISFTEKGNRQWNYEKYLTQLKASVADDPSKYLANYEPFCKLSPLFSRIMVSGLTEYFRKTRELDWVKAFAFIGRILELEGNWDKIDVNNEYNELDVFVYTVTDLIDEGTRNDDYAFPKELLPLAKTILLEFERKAKYKMSETTSLSIHLLNNIRSRIWSSLILYNLRFARAYDNNKNERMDIEVRTLFDLRLIERKDPSLNYSLGRYLNNILWLDCDWLEKNIDIIFDIEIIETWKYAFIGYLSNLQGVYKEIYIKLKLNNHLEKALTYDFGDDDINSSLINCICVGYINGWDNDLRENSIIKKVICSNDYRKIIALIDFCWNQADYLRAQKKDQQILDLFKYLFETTNTFSDRTRLDELYSKMCLFLIFMDCLTESDMKIFEVIISFAHISYVSDFILKELLRLIKISPKEISRLFCNMIKGNESYPYYDEEIVKGMFDELKVSGRVEEMKMIYNTLMERHAYQFKDILQPYLS